MRLVPSFPKACCLVFPSGLRLPVCLRRAVLPLPLKDEALWAHTKLGSTYLKTHLDDLDRFPSVRVKDNYQKPWRWLRCRLHQRCFTDAISRLLKINSERKISLRSCLEVCELGSSRLAELIVKILNALSPAVFFLERVPVAFYELRNKALSSSTSWLHLDSRTQAHWESIHLLYRRIGTTHQSLRLEWFTLLLGKYKLALGIVFVASLLAQLLGVIIANSTP